MTILKILGANKRKVARFPKNHVSLVIGIASLLISFLYAESTCCADNGQESDNRNRAASYATYGAVFNDYQSELNELAKKCDDLKMPLEAQVTRSFLYAEKPYYFVVPLLSDKRNTTELPDDASKNQRFWYQRLRKIRESYSREAYKVAERYALKNRGYDVVASILTALYIDPDNENARRFFGYSLKDGVWRSKWQLRQLEKGLVYDPKFGWIPEERLDRYNRGERFYKNQWTSKAEEAESILASSSGWRVETEHFSILSRVSLERGVEIGRFLESYYQAWSRLFYRFIATDVQWRARLKTDSEIVSKKHKVILYHDRKEYLRELKKHEGNIVQSNGGYFPSMRCTFVYEPGEDEDFELFPLLAHEATHQLFEECNVASASRNKTDFQTRAQLGNFWCVEGVAVYAETFRLNGSQTSATLGGYRDVFRVQCAMESLFEDNSYVKLREYAQLNRSEFQARKDLPLLYSEAAGLTFFFMHYKNGVYRDPFVTYLFYVYQGIDRPNTLEEAIGKSFEEIDAEYREFMSELYRNN